MNIICPICEEPYEICEHMDGSSIMFCPEDNLYMCPEASMPTSYHPNYRLHYMLYELGETSAALMRGRWAFVCLDGTPAMVLDFGCGIATFEHYKPEGTHVYSYDPYFCCDMSFVQRLPSIEVATFWDSFEHMRRIDIVPLLGVERICISLPILPKGKCIFEWKHYRPDEHVWYFSENALITLMEKWNYRLVHKDNFEEKLGRTDILSYIFDKRSI